MTDEDYETFVEEAYDYLRAGVAHAQEKWGVGEFDNFGVDFETNEFWWSKAGVRKVLAKPIVVGSFAVEAGTWLWSWDNPSLATLDMQEIERVKAFGEEHGIERLVEPRWSAEEADAWEVTAMAARLLESECAYRCPMGHVMVFLLLTDLRAAEEDEKA